MGKKILWLLATEPNQKQLMELVQRYGEDSDVLVDQVKNHELKPKLRKYLKEYVPEVIVAPNFAMQHLFGVNATILKSTSRPALPDEKPDFQMMKWKERFQERRVFIRFVEVQVLNRTGSHLILDETYVDRALLSSKQEHTA
jgi:hypothetical protein